MMIATILFNLEATTTTSLFDFDFVWLKFLISCKFLDYFNANHLNHLTFLLNILCYFKLACIYK